MWSATGLAVALTVGAMALMRLRARSGNFYETELYGISASTYRRYALVSGIFALSFLASFFWSAVPPVPLLAVYALIAILFLSSFIRGAVGEDE